MRYEVTLEDRRVRVELGEDGRFMVDDRVVAADVRETVRGRQWSITLEGSSHEITVVTHDPLRLDLDGRDVRATVVDERALRANRGAVGLRTGRVELRAPMPGLLRTSCWRPPPAESRRCVRPRGRRLRPAPFSS